MSYDFTDNCILVIVSSNMFAHHMFMWTVAYVTDRDRRWSWTDLQLENNVENMTNARLRFVIMVLAVGVMCVMLWFSRYWPADLSVVKTLKVKQGHWKYLTSIDQIPLLILIMVTHNILYRDIHRVRKNDSSILDIILTNLNAVLLFLAWIIPILQFIKTLENLAQLCNIVTWRWRHIWRHQKCGLQTKTDI